MYEESSKFGVVDYCMFGGMLLLTALIGLYTSYVGNKSPEEFLMGNRNLKPLPVGMSLLVSYVSSGNLLVFTGEIFATGMQISTTHLGAILAIIFSSYTIPVFHATKITSITEYIELRFKNKTLRQTFSIMKVAYIFLTGGVILFTTTIVLITSTNLNTLTYIFLLGFLCTLYSAFGGIRAVIWTDVFQLTVILIGLITMVIAGCYHSGGFMNTIHIASEGGRLDIFEMNLSPFVRHTFFNTIASGFFTYGYMYFSNQENIQRLCAVKTVEESKQVLRYNIYGLIVVCFLTYMGGLSAYAAYHGCDPLALGIIKRKEEIMPYFIADKLKFIPGLPGLFAATLVGGALSTLSTLINSCVAMMWRDFCLRFSFFQERLTKRAIATNVLLSLIVGVIFMGMAVLASKYHSIIELLRAVKGPFVGPIFGGYLIGFFLPKCNLKGVWAGVVVSFVIGGWLSFGRLFYKRRPTLLPSSTYECHQLNFTAVNTSTIYESHLEASNVTNIDSSEIPLPYQISYTLLVVIGPVICVLLAVIVSFITGNQSVDEISPKLISPLVRRLYWTKEELEFLQEDDADELETFNIKVDENNTKECKKISNAEIKS